MYLHVVSCIVVISAERLSSADEVSNGDGDRSIWRHKYYCMKSPAQDQCRRQLSWQRDTIPEYISPPPLAVLVASESLRGGRYVPSIGVMAGGFNGVPANRMPLVVCDASVLAPQFGQTGFLNLVGSRLA